MANVSENVVFLRVLAERLALDWKNGDRGAIEHLKDGDGMSAAYLAILVDRKLTKNSERAAWIAAIREEL